MFIYEGRVHGTDLLTRAWFVAASDIFIMCHVKDEIPPCAGSLSFMYYTALGGLWSEMKPNRKVIEFILFLDCS